MFIYMTYFITMQIMSFFQLGSFYVSIKIFFSNQFKLLTNTPQFRQKFPNIWQFFNMSGNLSFAAIFAYAYIILLILTVLVSIAAPIDRAISYFRIIAAIFSALTIISLLGISTFLFQTGLWPEEKRYNGHDWIPTGEVHFSWLTLCGMIMLSVYLLPILLRPLDFLYNAPRYLIGLISYIILLPCFINIMQVYSMCNLHDISWGNRPSASAGAHQLSSDTKKQQELKNTYMMFRINFLTLWICLNVAYALAIEDYATNQDQTVINTGQWGFLEIFAAYLAVLVIYRVFFGGMHILNFKFKKCCIKKYKLTKVDLHEEFKKLRRAENWNESIVDNDFQLLENAAEYRDDERILDNSIAQEGRRTRIKGQVNQLDKTCIDTDDDDFEFESARNEEEEDINRNDTTAFMVSKQNVSKYINETQVRNTQLPDDKKVHIPNKILDSMLLKYSELELDSNAGPDSYRNPNNLNQFKNLPSEITQRPTMNKFDQS